MSGVFFESLEIKNPDFFLGVPGGTGIESIAKMMLELEKVLLDVKPDYVIVYGDTNSTLAGAIVANKLGIKLAHIEAGLRQAPKSMPEESNRVIVDHLSDFLFTPTKVATENLLKEQPKGHIIQSGDIMYDLFQDLNKTITEKDLPLTELLIDEYVLVTLHRDFNVDDSIILESILDQISQLALSHQMVFPLHPRTKKNIERFNLNHCLENVVVIDPVEYKSMLALLKYSKSVITDSGGLQKEAYFFGKPAFVIMPDTSWRELIDQKFHCLVSSKNIIEIFELFLPTEKFEKFYGDGTAANQIINFLKKEFDQ
jgi:UDP-N-acetylglucosamine 2-epimerase (non-hydrolysing)